jgi:uncharacterized protein (DUF427 family)
MVLYESVAAYPRPPALVDCDRHVRVEVFGRLLCDTHRSLRVLETFHPPSFYLPPESLDLTLLEPAAGGSFCEWKGVARYFDLVGEVGLVAEDGLVTEDGLVAEISTPRRLQRISRALWQYPHPTPAFRALAGWYSLYPGLMDGCWLDGERVRPQPGGFYGGWISADLIGPFKGDPLHPELV